MAKNTAAATQTTDVDHASAQGAAATAKPAFKFKVKKHVTLPLLKIEESVPVYIRVTEPIFLAKEIEGTRARKNAEGAVQQPPHLANVTNLETGEEMQIIANEVLKSSLEDAYPDASYVGKSFEIVRKPIQKGKKYVTFTITEIEAE
jgi:hypothetical protein